MSGLTKLQKPQSPRDFLNLSKKLSASIPNAQYFNKSECKPYQEAWVFGHFAHGLLQFYEGIKIQLVVPQFPDVELIIDGKVYEFEITVADKPERKIGDVYKNPKDKQRYEPERGRQEGPSWIVNAVGKKYEKRYSPPPHLLVYANFEASLLDISSIKKLCEPYINSFPSIWILWEYKFVKIHDSGIFKKVDDGKWYSVGVDPWEEYTNF
jgi:hypothetical protein